MRLLVIFAALFLAVSSTETEHENWRRYAAELRRQSPVGLAPRDACDEPFVHELPFNCDLATSPEPPITVHKLSPGDVKVVGAIGDSITAANGAHACKLLEVIYEYRGASWSIGGDDDISSALTLPNILRLYNPDLIGYSLGIGNVNSNDSNLNCAVPGAVSSDMLGQAENLVDRIYADPDIDVELDWKVITLFVGGNDLCNHCDNPTKYTTEEYIDNIVQALDHFHEKLPRTFINVAGMLNMTELVAQETVVCKIALSILCSCITNIEPAAKLELDQLNREYQIRLKELTESGKYDTRDDFTVVYQPFMENTAFPEDENGVVDQSYMAPDCFHLSAKGHAFTARELWTNMLQPVGMKADAWDPYPTGIPCPTQEHPYFATVQNSKLEASTGQPRTRDGATPPVMTTPSTNAGNGRASLVSPLGLLVQTVLAVAWLTSL